jgi:hypothetical protein
MSKLRFLQKQKALFFGRNALFEIVKNES